MNTTMVDVTGIKDVEPGSEVVLFGSQQGKTISAAEMEKHAEVIFLNSTRFGGEARTLVST